MKRLLLTVFLISLFLMVCAQNEYSTVKGTVYNMENKPLPFANIKVKRSLRGTVTSYNGKYSLEVKPFDVVIVSSMGYKGLAFYIPADIPEVFRKDVKLIKDTILLDETIVTPWPATYDKLKREFVKLKPEEKDSTIQKKDFYLTKAKILEHKSASNEGMIVIPGPFSMLYNAFGDKPRQYRKLREDKKKIHQYQTVNKKLRLEAIKEITQIQEEDSLIDFLDECGITHEFILKNNEYDMYKKIKQCYKKTTNKKPGKD